MDLKVELRGKEQFQSDPVREGLVWPLPVLKTEGATNQGMQVAPGCWEDKETDSPRGSREECSPAHTLRSEVYTRLLTP